MSELEDALRTTLADPPVAPAAAAAEPLADIRRRLRTRLRRRAGGGALAAAALAASATGVAVNRSHDTAVTPDPVPAAVRIAAQHAAHAPGSHATNRVQWVRTTRSSWLALEHWTGPVADAGEQVYVIKLRGQFPCHACTTPLSGATVGTRTLTIGIRNGDTIDGDTAVDLSRLGTVHTFTLR